MCGVQPAEFGSPETGQQDRNAVDFRVVGAKLVVILLLQEIDSKKHVGCRFPLLIFTQQISAELSLVDPRDGIVL